MSSWQAKFTKTIDFINDFGKYPSIFAEGNERNLGLWLNKQLSNLTELKVSQEIQITSLTRYVKGFSDDRIVRSLCDDLKILFDFYKNNDRIPNKFDSKVYAIMTMFESIYATNPLLLVNLNLFHKWERLMFIKNHIIDKQVKQVHSKRDFNLSESILTPLNIIEQKTDVMASLGSSIDSPIIVDDDINICKQNNRKMRKKRRVDYTEDPIEVPKTQKPQNFKLDFVAKWGRKYNELCKFLEVHNRFPKPANEDENQLYHWVHTNKKRYWMFKNGECQSGYWVYRSKKWEIIMKKYVNILPKYMLNH